MKTYKDINQGDARRVFRMRALASRLQKMLDSQHSKRKPLDFLDVAPTFGIVLYCAPTFWLLFNIFWPVSNRYAIFPQMLLLLELPFESRSSYALIVRSFFWLWFDTPDSSKLWSSLNVVAPTFWLIQFHSQLLLFGRQMLLPLFDFSNPAPIFNCHFDFSGKLAQLFGVSLYFSKCCI